MPTKNNDSLWDREKMTISSRKLEVFLLLHITHWSVPRPSTREHDFTKPVPHEQGDRSKHPVTGNNTHLLPMNGDSNLTDRTLGNKITRECFCLWTGGENMQYRKELNGFMSFHLERTANKSGLLHEHP